MILSDEKFHAIERVTGLFSSVPFVDLAVLSGSCASERARDDSDIDIIIGAKGGRVWTARFFTLLFADAAGVRHKEGEAKDKLCLSLFISPGAYRMNDPENDYERELYPLLKPIFGDDDSVRGFFEENRGIVSDSFMDGGILPVRCEKNRFAKMIEKLFDGRFGDGLEIFVRGLQTRKIKRYMKKSISPGVKNRVILSALRIETHFRVD